MKLIDVDELKEWIENWFELNTYYHPYSKSNNIPIPELYDILKRMPTANAEPTREQFEWCHDCKEYDQNAHCCHRWTKVIRNTVNDLKTQGYEPVRHGHWEFIGGYGYQYRCSACNTCAERKTKFCSYCGAKMDAE